MKSRSFFVTLFALLLPVLAGAAGSRTITNFDAGWKFKLGDYPSAKNASFNDGSWRTLDVPHDWSIEGEIDQNEPAGGQGGYFPTGIGWYRKTFNISDYSRDRLYSIEFDGVYRNSEVWINGHYLGKYPYGYSSFSYDMTPWVKAGRNVIAVRVDNSLQPASRWYTGSGIYRHVRLVSTGKQHFEHWGVFAKTTEVDFGEFAHLEIDATIASPEPGTIVRHVLRHPDGRDAASGQRTVGTDGKVKTNVRVDAVKLWSLEDPYMYTLVSYLIKDGKEIDRVEMPFGVRTIRYEVNDGFFLNDKHVKMYGVNVHHDGGLVGAAVPERVWERRLQILKESGCNAIRTSHNIPAPEFLDLCDQLGLLVMDEVFDMWQIGKNPYDYSVDFDEWHRKDLACMVMRDRNHPSVVMWSIGNEVRDQASSNGDELAAEMIALCHELDDSPRLVTSGNDRIVADDTPATPEFLAAFANDIVGYNYPDRWRKRKETNYTLDKIAFPERRVVATEAGGLGGSRVTRAAAGGRGFFGGGGTPSARYIDTEQRWRYTIINDFVIGDFMWTGIDYYGEARWPSKGFASGYIDNCGFKKDGFWFWKSLWTDEPTLHLAGGWDYPEDKVGTIMQVCVFTNCDEIELFVNGKSYGKKTRAFPRYGLQDGWGKPQPRRASASTADLHLNWDVEYHPGEVKLVGIKDGKEYTEVIKTPGAPVAVRLSVDRETIKAAPGDVAHITAEIVDKDGNVVTSASNHVKFAVNGAEIMGVESSNMLDLSKVKAPERDTYGGMCLAIIKAAKPGSYTVTATSEGLASGSVSFKAE